MLRSTSRALAPWRIGQSKRDGGNSRHALLQKLMVAFKKKGGNRAQLEEDLAALGKEESDGPQQLAPSPQPPPAQHPQHSAPSSSPQLPPSSSTPALEEEDDAPLTEADIQFEPAVQPSGKVVCSL